MPGRKCTIAECERPHYARDMCKAHYLRWHSTGTASHPTLGLKILSQTPRAPNEQEYKRLHNERSKRNPASSHACVGCGNPADHWAYEYGCVDEKISEWGPYCPHDEHYQPRCVSCHTAQAIPRGATHYKALFTEDLVREIQELHAMGISQREIERCTGVDYRQVFKIVHRQSWKHVE